MKTAQDYHREIMQAIVAGVTCGGATVVGPKAGILAAIDAVPADMVAGVNEYLRTITLEKLRSIHAK